MLVFLLILLTALNSINCDENERIAGGTNVINRTQVPYQVTLRWNVLNTCGGVILNTRYVLTSAYCVDHNYTAGMKVIVGDIRRDPTSTTFETGIESIKLHEKYSKALMNGYDLALVRVKHPFVFSNYISSLDIWTSKKRPQYACKIAGYGLTENSGFSSQLKIAQVHVQDDNFCNKIYSDKLKVKVPPTEFCAGENGKDACEGDQGSPLVCENQLVGIRSKDFNCAGLTVNIPGLYLHVPSFQSWITRNMDGSPPPSPRPNASTALTATLLTLCISFVGMLL